MDVLYKEEDPGLAITPEYSARFHQALQAIDPVQGELPCFRFWYQGLYPCCIIGQTYSTGRIVLIDCLLGEQNSGIDELIDRKVIPVLAADYKGCTNWRDITNHGPLATNKSLNPSEHRLDQIIHEKLQGHAESGEPDFFVRLNAIKAFLAQTDRLTVNPAPTPGEAKPWIHEALAGGYSFRRDQSGAVSKSEARKFHPLTSVGEALGHGLAKVFFRKPAAPVKFNKHEATRRAKQYAV